MVGIRSRAGAWESNLGFEAELHLLSRRIFQTWGALQDFVNATNHSGLGNKATVAYVRSVLAATAE